MSLRRKARETALQILYKIDMSEGAPSVEGLDGGPLAPGTEARRYCDELVAGVTSRLDEINRTIEAHSENWTIERMAIVDRNILRIAVYELLYSKDVPYKVVIDEAVELAKRYGTEESGAFVNGIIDKVRKKTGSQGA
ncbi:MAG TPA: transcription antitermination factor NusB [Deltaproteobacteria bacterium]|nr:MAG: transcription antitermination factor NusB [Deltaproteobacteria bacterium GWA2_55_82]OGQ65222.1 MAG: transcription antitermination factor NusB [Deltaproteobacteria bacterium RIFCSPLOWO2_02_FULL_55_12]OIJ74782.1 MAG: transcription antitermination factor NusB [Deltaproteobacteria bacterium GWC2_55_46]HBG45712.1 transcription antitermination factor NusB [Deltaproteobacteria bacterium]HCY11120.1 transcription antitermination factor NusB [Deltaproteobacteria bacterium]